MLHYFEEAELVAMARLASYSDQSDQRVLEFELLSSPYKGDAVRADALRLVTATSTATCGVQPEVGEVYVVFGHTDAEGSAMFRIDTCSGTRVHMSIAREEIVGFIDVPARFVASQLNALAGLDVLRKVASNAPQPEDLNNDKLVGLLDLKALAHGGSTSLYELPDRESQVVAEIRDWDDVEHREVDYEVPAAVVIAVAPGWYRVRTSDGVHGWAAADDAGTWFPYAELPVRRLAYLSKGWGGLVWPSPGAGTPLRFDVRKFDNPNEIAINVLETTSVAGFPWFRVEVLRDSLCDGGSAKPLGTGWVPGYNFAGKPSVWFYSRGC